jgi:polyhydroxybutyrate depolymerase
MIASRFPAPLERLALVAVLALSACLSGGSAHTVPLTESPGTARHSVQVGALARTYLLHVPPMRPRRFGRPAAYPLVIVLHGSGANGETARKTSGMDSIADAQRFLVAYPNATTGPLGLGSDWNAGECCGPAKNANVNDVGFVRTLLSTLEARMPVDRRRVYVVGFSDGGRMAYHAACRLAAQIAAVAIVSGSLVDASCAPVRPVPLIAFHGTDDDEVPYDDSSYSTALGVPPMRAGDAPPSIVFWSTINHCRAADVAPWSAHVTLTRFAGCMADVELFTTDGGVHEWPRGASGDDDPAGPLDASREAWHFFTRHPRP